MIDDGRPGSDTIRAAIDLARRAPSLHNTQPWRFVLDRTETLRLLLDGSRSARSADPDGRQALIGNGAILDHVQMAADALGWRSRVTAFPDPNHPSVLATLAFEPAALISDGQRSRAEAIDRRATHRLPMAAPPDWDVFVPVVTDLLGHHDVRIVQMTGERLSAVQRASRIATAQRTYDWRYHAELAWWTSSTTDDDGIPLETLPSTREDGMVARAFPTPRLTAHTAGHPDHAEVVALCTPADDPSDHLECGRALSALLVEATVWGLASNVVSHLTEMPSSRAVLADAISDGWVPQILVRVGESDRDLMLPRTPRRAVDDILTDLTRTSPAGSSGH